jgi:predicted O-methyltransferase YrrM
VRLAYAARAGRAIALQPYEGVERAVERIAIWRDRLRPTWRYEVTDEVEERVHRLIGADWPCREWTAFEAVFGAAAEELAARGLRIGRGAFDGWDDGDARYCRLAWCLARHLHSARIVETGVAGGLSSRVLLEAIERNGGGRLWSIDLPPLLDADLARETAAAVPQRLRAYWTLLRGSSRRLLPRLAAELHQVDLFLHDSLHTTRNVRFELEHVWPALAPGGAALIDDLDRNTATGEFLERHPEATAAIGASTDERTLIGCLIKNGQPAAG